MGGFMSVSFAQLIKERKLSFTRLFYSCLILYVIPLFILGLLVYQYFFAVLDKSVMENTQQSLLNTSQQIGQQVDLLAGIRNSIMLDATLSDHYEPRQYTQVTKLKNKLKMYSLGNSFIHFIGVYCRGDDYFYTGNSSYHIEHFAKNYQIEGLSGSDSFASYLNSITQKKTLRAHGSSGETLHLIVFPAEKFSDKIVLFAISQSVLSGYLSNVFNSLTEGISAIVDADGTIIASYCKPSIGQNGEYESFCSSLQTGSLLAESGIVNHTEKVGKHDYLVHAFPVQSMNWRIVIISQNRVVLQNMIRLRMTWLFVLTGLLTIGLLFIALAVRFNYLPVYRLFIRANEYVMTDKSESERNELGVIDSAMEGMRQKISLLQNSAAGQKKATMDYLLQKMLRGGLSREEFNEIGQSINTAIRGSCYRVLVCMSRTHSVNTNGLLSFYEMLEEISPALVQPFIIHECDQNTVIVMFFYEECNDSVVTAALESLCSSALAEDCSVGISSRCMDTQQMNLCWAEAKNALSGRLLFRNAGQPVFYDRIVEKSDIAVSVKNQMRELRFSLEQRNSDRFYSAIIALNRLCSEKHLSERDINRLLLWAQHIIIDTFRYELRIRFPIPPEDIPILVRFLNNEECAELLNRWRDWIFRALGNIRPVAPSAIISAMIHYLEDHYNNCNFSVEQMASHFGMSLPALSQYFRDHTGGTVNDKLTECRIVQAKKLLAETNLSIKDVSLEVGYFHPNSFIRRFKQITGKTPGEFRKDICVNRQIPPGHN